MIYQKGNSWKVKGFAHRFGSLEEAQAFTLSLACEKCACDPCECKEVEEKLEETLEELSPVELLRKGLWNSPEETLLTTEFSKEELF